MPKERLKAITPFAPAKTTRPIIMYSSQANRVYQSKPGVKCLCAACMKSFTLDTPSNISRSVRERKAIEAYDKDSWNRRATTRNAELFSALPEDPACPECGNSGYYMTLTEETQSVVLQERRTVDCESEEGKRPKITDTVILDCISNPVGENPVSFQLRLSSIYDLENHTMRKVIAGSCPDATANIPSFVSPEDYMNIFTQRPFDSMGASQKFGIRHLESAETTKIRDAFDSWITSDKFLNDTHVPEAYKGLCTNGGSSAVSVLHKYSREDALVCTSFRPAEMIAPSALTDISSDRGNKDVTESERSEDLHFRDETAEVIPAILSRIAREYVPEERMETMQMFLDATPDMHGQLLHIFTQYPAAAVFATERAENSITDFRYKEIRRKEADPNYEIKGMTDKGKIRMYREAFNLTMNELCSCDNNITKLCGVAVPRGADGAKLLKEALRFPTFGDQNGANAVPQQFLRKDGSVPENAVATTKALKRRFESKPISTANNVYTARKIGILHPDAINLINQLADEYPNTEKRRSYSRGVKVTKEPRTSCVACAGCIAPIERSDMMSFIKCFVSAHKEDTGVVLNAMYREALEKPLDRMGGYYLLCETVGLYSDATKWATFDRLKGDAEKTDKKLSKEQMVANYLTYNGIRDAYRDFAQMFGEETYDKVNEIARQLKESRTAAETAPEQPKNAKPEKTQVMTRNDKPLFPGRTMREIHDELSHIAQQEPVSSTPMEYSAHDRELETSYPCPDNPNKTWSFHLMRDETDFVRTASVLHNCVATHGYRDRVRRGSCRVLYMENEDRRRVACIELIPSGNSWRLQQFQSDHDDALPERYVDVATRWMDEHDVSYRGNHDYERFGHPSGSAVDYHVNEVDEVTGTIVTAERLRDLQKKRYDAAKTTFGLDDDGRLLIPPVPDDLKDFE